MEEKIKKFIEENHKFVIILITILGSIHQIINIFLLSAESVKFFSITTAISDSIINLINITIITFLIFIFMTLVSISFTNKELIFKNYTEHNKLSLFYKKHHLIIYILLHLGLRGLRNILNIYETYYELLLVISYITIFFVLFSRTIPSFKWFKRLNNKLYFYFITISTFIIFPFLPLNISHMYDKEIYNIKKFENNLLETNKFNKVSVKYFNDKYLFLVVNDKKTNIEYILIKNINDIFEGEK